MKALVVLIVGIAATAALAQSPPAPVVALPATPDSVVQPPCCVVPAGTEVDIDFVDAISSKTAKIGAMFAIKLAEPIVVDGKIIVPAGALGQGEVIHVAKAGLAGKPGELILAVRYIDHDGARIPLRSMKYGRSEGKNRVDASSATVIAIGVIGVFISGGQVEIAAGAEAHAKVASATSVGEAAKAPPPTVQTLIAGEGKK